MDVCVAAAGAAADADAAEKAGAEKEAAMEDWTIGNEFALDVALLDAVAGGELLMVNGRGLPVTDAEMPGIGMGTEASEGSGQAEEMAVGMLMVGCEAQPADVAVAVALLLD